jgi:hypothetical protein
MAHALAAGNNELDCTVGDRTSMVRTLHLLHLMLRQFQLVIISCSEMARALRLQLVGFSSAAYTKTKSEVLLQKCNWSESPIE